MGWSSRSVRKEDGGGGIVGCMSGMLQLFDFHPFGTIDRTGSSSRASPLPPAEDLALCCTAGIEAPRNSLEVLHTANPGSLQQHHHQRGRDDDNDDIPMAFEIFARSESRRDWTYSDTKGKNPGVVARLMGLDIFPFDAVKGVREGGRGGGKHRVAANSTNDCSNNRRNGKNMFSHTKEMKLKESNREFRVLEKRCENIVRREPALTCSRSLPESPRISSARRSDVEHRLSLQIQKENIPPFVNINYVDGGPLASQLSTSPSPARNSDARKTTTCSPSSRKSTSPRLITSSNSPRLAKRREEKGQPRHSSTPPCSPRLKYHGEESTTANTTTITIVAAMSRPENVSSPRNSQTSREACTPRQAAEPRPEANRSSSRLINFVNGKPIPEGSLVRRGVDVMSRVQKKGGPPNPRVRESYFRVLDRPGGGALNKGQKPICDTLLKAHSVIPTTKNSPRQLRAPPSGLSTLSQSQQKTATASDDIPQRGSDDLDACNNRPSRNSCILELPAVKFTHKKHHHRHSYTSPLDRKPCIDALSSSFSSPDGVSSLSSSSSSSLWSSSSLSSTSSSSSASSLANEKEKPDALFVYPYIKAILELMGVRSNTELVSAANWYSPSHPLDPAIFTQLDALEHHHILDGHHHHRHGASNGCMFNTKSNKKFIFQLVDELLRERLMPHLSMRPWMMMTSTVHGCCIKALTGRQLLEAVWTDFRAFPSANCKIVHDVDMLVARDVCTGHHSSPINDSNTETLVETILFRIGQDISDALVAEAVADFLSSLRLP